MRSVRVWAVAVLAASLCAISAGPAGACVIGGFSIIEPDGAVRPGDWVSYTMYAVPSDESPGDSAFTISVNSVPVATGLAAPSQTGRWEEPNGRFQVPPLGNFAGDVTVTVQVESGVGPPRNPVLRYDGRQVAAAPAAQEADGSGPAGAGNPASPSTESVTAPAPGDATAVTVDAAPEPRSAPAARAVARAPSIARTTMGARRFASAGGTAREVTTAAVTRGVADGSRATKLSVGAVAQRREARRASRPSAAVRATREHGAMGVQTVAAAARATLARAAAEPSSRTSRIALALILLVAATGGAADIYAAAGGRRGPDPAAAHDADEIEAELQAMIAEQLAADAARDGPRVPVAV